MLVVLELDVADLAATRFAISPLSETTRASLRRVFGDRPWPDSATELFQRPRDSLAEIAAELAECHERLVRPHWERIRPVLEADMADRQRSGRKVLYQVSELGLALLDRALLRSVS